MDSVAVTVPLRPPTKKMKKRKELDALAPRHVVSRRSSGKRSSQELLSDSSDERSEYWSVATRGRKCRGRNNKTCPSIVRACSAFLACVMILVTASLIWLFVDVRQQLTVLRIDLDKVIAGNEGVPDALQECHSFSRDLRNNQTLIYSQISDLKLQINNYSAQITTIQHNLYQVQKWLQNSPKLTSLPADLASLSKSVADLGSHIADLNATVNRMKDTNAKIQETQNDLQNNITSIKANLLEISTNVQKPQVTMTNETKLKTEQLSAELSQLTNNLTLVNETVSSSLKYALDDQAKDHKKLVWLQDTTQNVSTALMSLKDDYNNKQKDVSYDLRNIKTQLNNMNSTNVDLNSKIAQLFQLYKSLENTTNVALTSLKPRSQREKRILNSDVNNLLQINQAGSEEVETTYLPTSGVLENSYTEVRKPKNRPRLST